VITGATGGMGALFVERFLINGDIVIATDTSDESLRRLAATASADGRLATIAGDLSEEDHGLRVAALARQKTGRVDILVNAAGFFPVQSFLEMSSHDWRQVVDINLTGAALIAKAVLPLMLGRGWGRIVNIGSASVYEGVPGQAHYVAAKAGVIGLSRSLAREFGEAGITVNVIAPGLTLTPAAEKALPKELREAQIERRALKREERAGDLVGTVFFLASPAADFITGQTIIVDGGQHMI
jgi:NAD(P)-dependent dehydrogenase (short-subunit alcohol dehydrogenase family)